MPEPIIKTYKIPESVHDYPSGTVAEAGFLVSGSSGWRTAKPVVDAGMCSGCLRCYLACPDGCVVRKGKAVEIDLRFCKGCGICAFECKPGAIKMREETK